MTPIKLILFLAISLFFFSVDVGAQTVFKGEVLDANSGEGLAFATIADSNSNRGTISNSEGKFEFRTQSCSVSIDISYIGYEGKSIELNCENNSYLKIELAQSPITLDDVNVFHKDYVVELLKKARRKNVVYMSDAKMSKAFFRFYSLNSDQAIEFYEGFYNVKSSVDGIHNVSYKSGRHRFAELETGDGYFATTYLSPILEFVRLFTKSDDTFKFPDFPFQLLTKRELKENFEYKYSRIRQNGSLIHQIEFESSIDSGYKGSIYLDSLLHLRKISSSILFADNETKPIVPHGSGQIIGKMNLNYEVYFEEIDRIISLNHMLINYDYTYVQSSGDTLNISTKLSNSNFNYDRLFNLPVYPSLYKGYLSDLLLSSVSPFFEEIYQHENIIVRSSLENKLNEYFENEATGDWTYWSPIMKIEPWRVGFQLDSLRLKHGKRSVRPVVHNGMTIAHPVYENHYIETFDYFDFICYEGKPKFVSETMFDYYNSFSIAPSNDSLFQKVLLNYFHLDKLYSLKTEYALRKSYANRCPDKREIMAVIRKFNRLKKTEKGKYNDRVYYYGKDLVYDFKLVNDCSYELDIMKFKAMLK
jgi:hypothetical protein